MTIAHILRLAVLAFALPLAACSQAHEHVQSDNHHQLDAALEHAKAHYIANAGIMAVSGTTKVLFDPFTATGYDTYLEVPDAKRLMLIAGDAPYDDIDAVFISHAHGDHFDAGDMIAFMSAQTKAQLILPAQALEMMQKDASWDAAVMPRITSIDMDYGDAPEAVSIGDITATAVRIPHAGWPAPRRAALQNMVYRVSLDGDATVMHMGDADVNDVHYAPFNEHWQKKITDTAFPPYWFFTSETGQTILKDRLNTKRSIGVHVPLNEPQDLKDSGQDYFSISGETREIGE